MGVVEHGRVAHQRLAAEEIAEATNNPAAEMLDAFAPLFLELLAKCQIGGRAGIGHLSSA